MVDMVKVLAAKKEAAYATDALPTLAANAVLTRNFSSKPVEMDRLERNLDRGSFGASPSAPSNERQTVSYEVELAGSGAAGTAPAWMELLEGCGMAPPVVTAGVDVLQRFAAAGAAQGSLTQYHWKGDQRRKMVGSRGTFSIDFTVGAYPFITMNYTGIIPAFSPFDVNVPGVPVLTRWDDPLEVNVENTLLQLDSYAVIARSLRLDANVSGTMRNMIGSRYMRRGNHGVTGRLSVEAPSLAAKDYLSRLRSGARVGLDVSHGTGAGRIIELNAPRAQVVDIEERDEDGILMWDVQLLLTIDTQFDLPDLTIRAR